MTEQKNMHFICKTGFRVSSLPLTPPKYPFDTNVAGEFGATQNKNLSVLWCLYFDQVALCSSKLSGFCIFTSEQSVFQCLYLFVLLLALILGIKINDQKYSAIPHDS